MYRSKKRSASILGSPNFRDGAFRNLSETPMMASDVSYFKVFREAINRAENTKPPAPLPAQKTDLSTLSGDTPVIVWFGHSSYFLKLNGLNILIDPVFSGSASPVPYTVKAFPGSDLYSVADMPEIDLLIITHNHYDHLDKKTISALKPKIKQVVTGLGVTNDLACYGISTKIITELDWWQSATITETLTITATPARHFSGRGLKRGGSLWASFVLKTTAYSIYLGGDSGYDSHFKKIGESFGPFDLAVLECGQYDASWPLIHMMPEETAQAAADLGAKLLLPVHWGKFTLANHAWNDPIIRVVKAANEKGVRITTPMIGQPVYPGKNEPITEWWNF